MRKWKLSLVVGVALAALGMAVLGVHARDEGEVAGKTAGDKSDFVARAPVVKGKPEKSDVSPEIARLIERTKSQDWRVRARAARELGWKRDQAAPAVPALIWLLGDRTPGEIGEASPGSRAFEALRLIGKPAVPMLIETLKDKETLRRRRAADLLAAIGDVRAVEPLISALSDRDKSVHAAAIGALTSLADRRAVEPLAAFIKDETKDEYCRWKAVEALGALPTPKAVQLLAGILKDEGEKPSRRSMAAIALGKTGDRHATDILLGMMAIKKGDLRTCIFWGLGKTGDPRVVSPLIEALKNREEDLRVRQAAAIGLGRSRAPEAVRYLLSAVEDRSDNRRVRQSMMAALAFAGDPRAMDRLFKELKDGELQFAAALALPNLSDRKAVGPLIEQLKNDSPTVRRLAAQALGELKERRAVEPLKALLKDRDRFVAAAAHCALARIEGPPWSALDVLPSYLAILAFEDDEARGEIIGPH